MAQNKILAQTWWKRETQYAILLNHKTVVAVSRESASSKRVAGSIPMVAREQSGANLTYQLLQLCLEHGT
jgi:hypothetical protein